MTRLVRLLARDEPDPIDPIEPEPLDPSLVPELSVPPRLPEFPVGAEFVDVGYPFGTGTLPLRFTLDETDLPLRMKAIAHQLYALEGTRGLDKLDGTFLRIGRAPIVTGPELDKLETKRRVLLAALRTCRAEIDKAAKRTCAWVETIARGFAVRHLTHNKLQTRRERDRYLKPPREGPDQPDRDDLLRRDLNSTALLGLARAWRPITRAVIALARAGENLNGLISDAMMRNYEPGVTPPGAIVALVNAYLATMRDPRVRRAAEQKEDRDRVLQEAIVSGGTEHPLLFRIWSQGELARKVMAALDGARTDSDQIVALRKIRGFKEAIVDALEHARSSAASAIDQVMDADDDIVWTLPPLLEKVRDAAGIERGTLEWFAIEERIAAAQHHWISKASAAASLVAMVPQPFFVITQAIDLAFSVLDIAYTLYAMHRGNAIADAALNPSDSVAASDSIPAMFAIMAAQIIALKLLGRLGTFIGVVANVVELGA